MLVAQNSTRYTQDLAAPLPQILGDGSATCLAGQERLAAGISMAQFAGWPEQPFSLHTYQDGYSVSAVWTNPSCSLTSTPASRGIKG